MRWVGVMRWASGRVGRVILRMIPSRRVHAGLCRIMRRDYAKHLARCGDLLRRAADLSAARIPPGLVVVVSVHVCLMAPGYHSLVASFTDLG